MVFIAGPPGTETGHHLVACFGIHRGHSALPYRKRLVEIQKEAGISAPTNEMTICTGNLHGSDMLVGVRKLPEIVLAWLKQMFTPGSARPTATPSATPSPDAPTPMK